MDYYWRQGLTNKACTDTICSWNKYGSHKTVLQPVLAKNLQWRKPKFGKQKTEHLNLLKSIETSDPFSFEEIKEALLPVCPKAVVFQGQKDISPDDIFHVDVSTSAPPPLCDMLYICKSQTEIKSVLESFSDENVKLIAESTVGQSDNNLWASHRKCRITSSFVHDVFTRINSLKSGKRGDNITSVLMKILHSESFDYKKVPQLKYGIEMESEAKMSYTKFMLSSGHSNFCVLNVGLIVLQDKPQYGASPDGIVSCSCCQDGLVEIKCPMSIAHTCPSESNLPYLVNIGELCSLKKTHKYYSQIQWQMGISHLPWCDFFVYTRHGHFLERIPFDEKHFKNIICNCDQFYSEFVIPTILNKSGDYNIDVQVDVHNISDAEYDVHNISDAEYDIHNISDAEYDNYMKITKPITNQVNPPCKRRKTKHSPLPIYLCEICLNVCVSEDSIDNSDCNSVLCDKCLLWYHFKCVDYIDGSEDEWFCPNCK
ncbi:uncharacterized protein LOC126820664 [Patella vulgata]|uniref:uncharacterized protein LOC126820664 n=1 Tax=Patella vulgata TaxID=6465 RepID=UPI0024A7C397|nr:uncharacterized protein LOC126820664 [Patella vulgata]